MLSPPAPRSVGVVCDSPAEAAVALRNAQMRLFRTGHDGTEFLTDQHYAQAMELGVETPNMVSDVLRSDDGEPFLWIDIKDAPVEAFREHWIRIIGEELERCGIERATLVVPTGPLDVEWFDGSPA